MCRRRIWCVAENVEMLAQRKHDFVFKPLHGFAGRGLLDSAAVGRARLRRLVKHGEGYVAQRWVPKPCIEVDGVTLMDGSPGMGLSGGDLPPFRARLPAAGPAGANAAGRLAADLCVSLALSRHDPSQ